MYEETGACEERGVKAMERIETKGSRGRDSFRGVCEGETKTQAIYSRDLKLYTTKTGAPVLGVKPNTLLRYAMRFGIGVQLAGPNSTHIFTIDDLREIRRIRGMGKIGVYEYIQEIEDRKMLNLGPLYNPDLSPR